MEIFVPRSRLVFKNLMGVGFRLLLTGQPAHRPRSGSSPSLQLRFEKHSGAEEFVVSVCESSYEIGARQRSQEACIADSETPYPAA